MEEKQQSATAARGPIYHVIYHCDRGLKTKSFNNKRELRKHLKPIRPESIVGMFKGTRLHAQISNDYKIV
jgi:hypothetical protein